MRGFLLVFTAILQSVSCQSSSSVATRSDTVPSTTTVPSTAEPSVNPFVQSEVLLPVSVPNINHCRDRCLRSRKRGLGFASIVFNVVKGVVEGGADSVVGAVEGVWSIASNPNGFVLNIVHAGFNPKATALAIANSIKDYCTASADTTAESIGKCVGNAAGQIGMMFIGVGEVKEASAIAKGAEIIGQEAEYAELLKNVPKCAALARRSLFKRGPTVPCIPQTVDEAVASATTQPLASDEEIAQLPKKAPKKPKLTAAEKAQKAADKVQRSKDLEAALAKKSADRAAKQALLAADPVANGLPTTASFEGKQLTINYAKSFNQKHFNANRGGLPGANTNTVIKDASQVKFGPPVKSVLGTGDNAIQVYTFTSDAPVDLEVYARNEAGGFDKVGDINQPLSISGIMTEGSTDTVLITHYETDVVAVDSSSAGGGGAAAGGGGGGEVTVNAVTDDLGEDGSSAALIEGGGAAADAVSTGQLGDLTGATGHSDDTVAIS